MIPLIYALKNGETGNAGQMALATLDGLRDEFVPYLFAPQGEVVRESQKLGLVALPFTNTTDFLLKLRLILAANPEIAYITTDYKFSRLMIWLNFFYHRKITHLNLIDEAALENGDAAKRNKLGKYDVTYIAHSRTTREKLIAAGARADKIRVVENFLSEKLKNELPRKAPFQKNGVKEVVVVSKIEADKKIGLLFDALDLEPALSALRFTIYGTGGELEQLKTRAAKKFPNVKFAGDCEDVPQTLVNSDLYLNFCADESNGLTVLEAMAVDVPVLTPNGDSEAFITHNVNGFSFKADNARDLAMRLCESSRAPRALLNSVTKGGRYLLNIKFSSENGVERYRRLLNEQKVTNVDLTRGKVIL